jgi:hypothetical protein
MAWAFFPFDGTPQDQVKYVVSSEFMVEMSLVVPLMFETPNIVAQLLSQQVFHTINKWRKTKGKFLFQAQSNPSY